MTKQKSSLSEFKEHYQDAATAKNYDSHRTKTVKQVVVRKREQELFRGFTPPGSRVLEIGAGTGNITLCLASDCQITATDSSDAMLQIAAERLGGASVTTVEQFNNSQTTPNRVTLINMDMFDINKLQTSFDVVLASRVFLHLAPDNLGAMLEKIVDLLDPNGVLLFDLQRPNLFKKYLDRFEPGKVYNYRYTLNDIRTAIKGRPEFQLETIIRFEHFFPLLPFAFIKYKLTKVLLPTSLLAVDRSLASVGLTANRMFVVCRRK